MKQTNAKCQTSVFERKTGFMRLVCLVFSLVSLPEVSWSGNAEPAPRFPTENEAVENAVCWLIRRQNPDGSWCGAGLSETALATLAVSEGFGMYWYADPFADSIRRGRAFLCRRLEAGGDDLYRSDPFGFTLAAYALSETPDLTKNDHQRDLSVACVERIAGGQGTNGFWRSSAEGNVSPDDEFLTMWSALALESALRTKRSEEKCIPALSLFVRTFRGKHEAGFDPGDDGPALAFLLSAEAEKLSGNSDRLLSAAAKRLPARFRTEGQGTDGGSLLHLACLLQQIAVTGADVDFGAFMAWNRQVVRGQNVLAADPMAKSGEISAGGFWESPAGNEFRFRIASSDGSPEREGPNGAVMGDDESSNRFIDTCFCLLQITAPIRHRLLLSCPPPRVPSDSGTADNGNPAVPRGAKHSPKLWRY